MTNRGRFPRDLGVYQGRAGAGRVVRGPRYREDIEGNQPLSMSDLRSYRMTGCYVRRDRPRAPKASGAR